MHLKRRPESLEMFAKKPRRSLYDAWIHANRGTTRRDVATSTDDICGPLVALSINSNFFSNQQIKSSPVKEEEELPDRVLEFRNSLHARSKFLEEKWFSRLQEEFREERRRGEERLGREENSFRVLQEARRKKREEQENVLQLSASDTRTSRLYSLLVFRERKQREAEHAEQLTREEQRLVDEAFSRPLGDPSPIRAEIRRRDLETLRGKNWLNDEVINEFFALLESPRVKPFSTFFFAKLARDGAKAVRRWTRKFDVFGFELLLLPVHLSIHWTLIAVHLKQKKISFLDSLLSDRTAALAHLRKVNEYLKEEFRERHGGELEQFQLVVEEVPQQGNGSDCGVFCCQFARNLAHSLPLHLVTQDRMELLRETMKLELITGKLRKQVKKARPRQSHLFFI